MGDRLKAVRLPCLQWVAVSRQSGCPVYSGWQSQGSQAALSTVGGSLKAVRLPCLQWVAVSRQSDCPVYSGWQAEGSQVCNARLTGGRHSSVKLTDEHLIRTDTTKTVDDCELCAGCCCCQGYRNLCHTYPASPKTSPGRRYFLHLVTFHVHASMVWGQGGGGGRGRMVSEVNLSANVGAGDNSRV